MSCVCVTVCVCVCERASMNAHSLARSHCLEMLLPLLLWSQGVQLMAAMVARWGPKLKGTLAGVTGSPGTNNNSNAVTTALGNPSDDAEANQDVPFSAGDLDYLIPLARFIEQVGQASVGVTEVMVEERCTLEEAKWGVVARRVRADAGVPRAAHARVAGVLGVLRTRCGP